MDFIGFLWNEGLINPMINALIILANVLFDNFGLAIIAFTILIRVAMTPLTLRQFRTTRAMQEMQPQLQEIQKKYKDPKRRQQEMMKLYREVGFNPLGCILPFALQMPIWIALFHVIRRTLGTTPEALLSLSSRLYDWDFITEAVPLSSNFLFLDLAESSVILAALVLVVTFYHQKLSTAGRAAAARDDRQAATNRMMLIMMPLLFGWFTMTVPSGLGLYWFINSLVGMVTAYFHFRPSNITLRWFVSLEALPPSPAAIRAAGGSVPAAGGSVPAAGVDDTPLPAEEQPERAEETEKESGTGQPPPDSAASRRRRRRRRRRASGQARRE